MLILSVGAALWAADIDANDESMTDSTAPSFQEDSPQETGVIDKTE